MMVAMALVTGLTAVAAVTDLRWHKIYNWLTYPGMLVALLVAFGPPRWNVSSGWEDCLQGWAVCGGLMVTAFLLFPSMGGGDVKLIAMQGAYLGVERGVLAMLWTFVFAAVAALAIVVWRVGAWRLLREGFGQLVWLVKTGRPRPLAPSERAVLQPALPLAAAALPAVLVVCFDLERWLW
jgi:Flp pilus assembly protein protease CpaA